MGYTNANPNSSSGSRKAGKRNPETGPIKSKSGTDETAKGTGVIPGGNQAETAQASVNPLVDNFDLTGLETDQYTDEAVTVKTEKTTQPAPDEKGAAWRMNPQARKLAKREAQQTAVILLTMLDGIAAMFYGPNAGMMDYEREMVTGPLERILMRMDIVSTDALARWSDPLLLAMGLVAWISRVNRERAEARQTSNQEPAQEPTQAPPRPRPEPKNGTPPPGDIILTEQLTAPSFIKDQIQGDRIE